MTDKELAATVRDLFEALRRSIKAARDAGLQVRFDEDIIEERLDQPSRTFTRSAITIMRPL